MNVAIDPVLLSALLYAAGRFVPIPILDDLVREQIALWMLRRVTERAGSPIPRSHLVPLASPQDGCLGCLLSAALLPVRLILFPIRMFVSVVLGARNLTRDVTEIVLLSRVAERGVKEGWLDPGKTEAAQRAECLVLRRALDRSLRGESNRVLSTAVRAALGPLGRLVYAGVGALRRFRRAGGEAQPEVEASSPIAESAGALERALAQPAVKAELGRLEGRFDTLLAEERAKSVS
jgi:hypothetical protein